jgi:tetratricopeptide (TPR) repeat protein
MDYNRYAIVTVLILLLCPAALSAADDPFTAAGALYSQSVDLANAGKYTEALDAADQALAYNVTSINHIIQANRAGILVMLGRYDEAITAADAALAVQGNITATHAAAYYNKGDALRHLGRTDEARAAFEQAYSLDNTYTIPADIAPSPTKSPLFPVVAVVSIAAAIGLTGVCRKK